MSEDSQDEISVAAGQDNGASRRESRDPLNFFEPFEQLPAWHENQLTRAFLVVLRHSPLAHQAWLRLVVPDRALHELGPAQFRTQQSRIIDAGNRTDEERIPGISVIQAADAPAVSGEIVDSERRAIYDGVIVYGDDLVVVLESKLDGPISDAQARHVNRREANIDFDPTVRSISWRDVLDAFSDLTDSDRALTAGAERAIIEDFLEFCQRHFKGLLPFSTLRRCGGDPQRIKRRLAAVLAGIASDPQDADGNKLMLRNCECVERAYLDINRSDTDGATNVGVWMFPADTLGQGRKFWPYGRKIDGLRELKKSGWNIEPNMHFTYMGTGLVDLHGGIDINAYLSFWHEHINDTRALLPDEWNNYLNNLIEADIATPSDRFGFDEKFTRTNRHNAVPVPGLMCHKQWDLAFVEQIDDEGQLCELIRETINEMLDALDEKIIRVESV